MILLVVPIRESRRPRDPETSRRDFDARRVVFSATLLTRDRTAHRFCGFFFYFSHRQQVSNSAIPTSHRIRYVLPTGFATFVPFFFVVPI